MIDFCVTKSPAETVTLIKDAVMSGSLTGALIDEYTNDGATVLVFDKHYYRAGNRLTLTVVIDTYLGNTHIHAVGGGGGEGLFRFDWGASESFEDSVRNALRIYAI